MTSSSPLRVGVLLCGPVQLLDLAAVDLLGMVTPEYLGLCKLLPQVVALGRELEFSYIAEGKKEGETEVVTAGAKIMTTVSVPTVDKVQDCAEDVDHNISKALTRERWSTRHPRRPRTCIGLQALPRSCRLPLSHCSAALCPPRSLLRDTPRRLLGPPRRQDSNSAASSPVDPRAAGPEGELGRLPMGKRRPATRRRRAKASGGVDERGNYEWDGYVAAYVKEKFSPSLAKSVCDGADVGERSREYGTPLSEFKIELGA